MCIDVFFADMCKLLSTRTRWRLAVVVQIKASRFPTTLVVGYTNGCVGYLPTEAEIPYGGYECVHSHRGYNKMMPLASTAEHQVLTAATTMVAELAAEEEAAAVGPVVGAKAAFAAAAAAIDAAVATADSYIAASATDGEGGGLGGAAAAAAAPLRLAPPPAFLEKKVLATVIESGFEQSHDTYNGVSVAKSDGKVYFAISSQERDVGGHCFSYDPTSGEVDDIGDLTAACNEDPKLQVAQGKSHVPFFENPGTGELIFGTHVGFYAEEDGMEVMARPEMLPEGFGPYPGGAILSLTPKSKDFAVLGRVPGGEGIVTMNVDHASGRCFVLTWPNGKFIVYDKNPNATGAGGGDGDGGEGGRTKGAEELPLEGTVIEYPGRGGGEGVHPRTGDYRCICRTIATIGGCAYFTNAEGTWNAFPF